MRILNLIMIVFAGVVALQALVTPPSDPAMLIGQWIGVTLIFLPYVLAFRAFGKAPSLRIVIAALWVNALFVAGLAAYAIFGSASLRFVLPVLLAFSPVFLNLWPLHRLNRRMKVTSASSTQELVGTAATLPLHSTLNGADRGESAPRLAGDAVLDSKVSTSGTSAAVASGNSTATESTRTRRTNYFLRHWRGELPLAVSYWINGSLLNALLIVAYTVASEFLTKTLSLRATAFISIGQMMLATLVPIWSVVGIWRSAQAHPARGGSKSWAAVAQAFVILGLLSYAGQLTTHTLPAMKEMSLIAFGADPFKRIKLTLTNDGRGLVMSGTFGTESADDVRRIIAVAPGIQTVILDSPGGRLKEASEIAQLVRERHLNTYVEGHCDSACTYVFLAGEDRAATPNARIGFHNPDFPGLQAEDRQASLQEMLSVYRVAGVTPSFLERVAATPADQVWYPTRDELIVNKVINRITLGGESTLSGTALRSKEELRLTLHELPLYVGLERRFPGISTQVVDAGWAARERGATDTDIQTAMRTVISSRIPALLKQSSDETLERFLSLTIDELGAARAVNYSACARLLRGTLNIAQVLPPEIVSRDLEWTQAAVIEDAGRSNRSQIEAATQAAAFKHLGLQLEPKSLDVVGNLEKYNGQSQLQCDSVIDFYAHVKRLPQAERLAAMHVMFQPNE